MRNIFNSIALMVTLLFVGACTQEELVSLPNGTIRFVIGQSVEATNKSETRATPAELGKPLADKFNLTVLRNGSTYPAYEGQFKETMELPIGTYTITAECGEDVKIGRDAPYYVGTAQATIETDKSSSVVIPCRVGNALVSVRFGSDTEQKARFDRHYIDYGVMVKLGTHFMTITPEREASSIYFPAGSSPELVFYGNLKSEPSRQVTYVLQSDVLPTVFQAADHGILTLTLPDPESSLVVQVGKAEVETITLEESIPLSWLPAPRAQANHAYDSMGNLRGTDVVLLHPYPSGSSKTVITNADGVVVRTVEGCGNKTSAYNSSADWPYLSAGNYTATYYIMKDGEDVSMNTVDFTIPQPAIALSFGGYTSYTKYKEGSISAANSCNANTIYSPSVTFNVSPSLLGMSKYAPKFTCSYAGAAVALDANVNTYAPGNQTGLAASFTPYTLSASAAFDGMTFNGSRDFYITGLPVNYTPPTDDGWVTDGAVSFYSDNATVGNWKYSSHMYKETFAVPQGTAFEFTYNVLLRSRAATSALIITLGDDELFHESKYAFGGKNYTYQDTKKFTLTSNATQFKCATTASIGGDNYGRIYSIVLKYAN